MSYRSRLFLRAKRERRNRRIWRTRTRIVCTHGFFLTQDVSITPHSLHGVSHDNMSRDSDQGLRRSARAEENKYIGPINCGSFRRRPLFTILHIELLFRTLFMASQTYTRFFSSFAFVRVRIERGMRDRCQVTVLSRNCCMRKICDRTSHFSW